MNRPLRVLLGVGIVAILAPAMALVIPDRITSLLPWQGSSPTVSAASPAIAAVDREIQLTTESTNPPTTHQTPSSQETPPGQEVEVSGTDQVTSPSSEDHDESHGSTDTDSTEAETDPTSSTRATDPPNTSTTSTTSTSSRSTSGTIAGQACPCTVTGTAELKGDVSLQGDLIVEGGTLVARPGVNVNGNGFQIMFMDGGKADFQGSKVFTWSDRGAKQNLERDVVFRNMRRIMWMNSGGASTLKYIQVADSGTSALGDYPLHWHLNGNSTRGTIVEGVVVINGRNHAFVPHGSHGITFRDTIAKNTTNDAYWWDPPGSNGSCTKGVGCDPVDNSNDIIYDHALADGVNGSRGVSGFLLGAGNNLTVRNSAAINVSSSNPSKRFCAGFKWPEFTSGSSRGVNTVWRFENNYSWNPSGCDGINVWQNDSENHEISGFSGSGIDHGAYGNRYLYTDIDVTGVLVHAAGWRIVNGHAGDVIATKHRSDTIPTVEFDNVAIDSFTIRNAQDGGETPGHYVLNGTGIKCDEIVYESVVPGTKVIIDGTEC